MRWQAFIGSLLHGVILDLKKKIHFETPFFFGIPQRIFLNAHFFRKKGYQTGFQLRNYVINERRYCNKKDIYKVYRHLQNIEGDSTHSIDML